MQTLNQRVEGSSPSTPTNKINMLTALCVPQDYPGGTPADLNSPLSEASVLCSYYKANFLVCLPQPLRVLAVDHALMLGRRSVSILSTSLELSSRRMIFSCWPGLRESCRPSRHPLRLARPRPSWPVRHRAQERAFGRARWYRPDRLPSWLWSCGSRKPRTRRCRPRRDPARNPCMTTTVPRSTMVLAVRSDPFGSNKRVQDGHIVAAP